MLHFDENCGMLIRKNQWLIIVYLRKGSPQGEGLEGAHLKINDNLIQKHNITTIKENPYGQTFPFYFIR